MVTARSLTPSRLPRRVEDDSARGPLARKRLDLDEVGSLQVVSRRPVQEGEARGRLADGERAPGAHRAAVDEDIVAATVDVLPMVVAGEDEDRGGILLARDVLEEGVREPMLVDEDDVRSPR